MNKDGPPSILDSYRGSPGILTPHNLRVVLGVWIEKSRNMGIEKHLKFNITWNSDGVVSSHTRSRLIKCYENKPWCDEVFLFDEPITHRTMINATITCVSAPGEVDWVGRTLYMWTTGNPGFPTWEIAYRYTMLALCIAVLIAFIIRLGRCCCFHRLRQGLTEQQRWVFVLLAAAILLDNPIFACDLLARGHWAFPFVDSLFRATWICVLLLHVLITFGSLAADGTKHWVYIGRFVLAFVLWALLIVANMWQELHAKDDPTYSAVSEVPGFIFFRVVALIVLGLACVWHLFTLFRLFGKVLKEHHIAKRFLILFATIHILVVLQVVSIVLYTYLPPEHENLDYLTLFAIGNVYAWLMAFFFSPSTGTARDGKLEAAQSEMTERVPAAVAAVPEGPVDLDGADESAIRAAPLPPLPQDSAV
eukprot:gnl/Trimastix_PCT/2529.p1 GENE.gnl/Trimastix_PCT/2529~~gnl/Trimastix_PCT/2529.p1  ORF type:complete len:420 (+),score=124.16 gnl/Trimastix_PCT/2529:231-1490(+)